MSGHNRFYTKAEMEAVMKEALVGYAELEARLNTEIARAAALGEKLKRIAALKAINIFHEGGDVQYIFYEDLLQALEDEQ